MEEIASVQSVATPTGIPTGKFGMWVFLVSEIMFFTGLIGSYIVLRLGSASWPRPGEVLNTALLGINTMVLITSSLTMALALNAAQQNRPQASGKFLLATALLGCAFLAIKIYDYAHMVHRGFTISSSLFGSCYYLLTGFHALHVLSGVVVLLYLMTASRLSFSSTVTARIEYSGLYWHFIDIVWVILFAILCLV
ncbi:MAG: heme-copper oxidase subunit III [Candidatus Omnitrophica bacterium]|nr:heme-copper oxidase subunit III [Candidatus Omnitrophota bacterium]